MIVGEIELSCVVENHAGGETSRRGKDPPSSELEHPEDVVPPWVPDASTEHPAPAPSQEELAQAAPASAR